MKVAVLGAGVVGVAAAYYLARDGHEVTVVERNDQPATETSYGNAGLVSPGDSYAWASPGALRIFLKSLYRRDLGIRVRPQLDPHFYRWSLRFLRQCTHARARINTERKFRLAVYARDCINALAEDTGVDYHSGKSGILYFYRSQQSLDAGAQHFGLLAELGFPTEVVGRARMIALDPALANARGTLAGAVYSPTDQTGDSARFTRELARWCEAQAQVRLMLGSRILRLDVEGSRVVKATTDKGDVVADAFVLALGAESPLLVRHLGIDLPIYPIKGYSLTVPIADGKVGPMLGGVDEDRYVAYSRQGTRLRLASTAEFAGLDRTHKPRDFASLFATGADLFPGYFDPAAAERWVGLRPMTPTSVPVHGRARFDNLYLDTGHGHVGWTMACGSGKLTADLIAGRKPEIDTQGLLYGD